MFLRKSKYATIAFEQQQNGLREEVDSITQRNLALRIASTSQDNQ